MVNNLQSKASQICLACGICCLGVLHNRVPLKTEEIQLAQQNKIEIVELKDNKYGFLLPCIMYRENRCSVYFSGQPFACKKYLCKLYSFYTT